MIRVKKVAIELQKWIMKKDYTLLDVERACAHLASLENEERHTFKEEATKNEF